MEFFREHFKDAATQNVVNFVLFSMPIDERAWAVLLDLLRAIRRCEDVGCINHLDCWDEASEEWYEPIERAEQLIKAKMRREADTRRRDANASG